MKFQFTRVSNNAKTGPIPTTMTERGSCPDTCPLKRNGCYADNFPLSLHWDRVVDTGITLEELCKAIAALPRGQLWRHNAAGDLPGDTQTGEIDSQVLYAIALANHGKRGFSYTHRSLSVRNVVKLQAAQAMGFTVNVSANSAQEATDIVRVHELPTVCLLPRDESRKSFDVGNVKVVTCPAALRDDVTCASCGMCADAKRKFVIGFPAHGVHAKKADLVAKTGA